MLGGRTCAWRKWCWVERPLSVLTAWDGRTWAWRKTKHPPLVLTAWGGRTWAWYRVERPLPVLSAWDGRTWAWPWWRKIERPPLILIVLGGRTRAHLDDPSQASSPYLNCVGWQDKLTVEVMNHNALWSASETSHHSNAAELILFSYCFVMVAWSIESRKNQKKNGHSGGEVGFQVPSYYDTVLYNNSRLL